MAFGRLFQSKRIPGALRAPLRMWSLYFAGLIAALPLLKLTPAWEIGGLGATSPFSRLQEKASGEIVGTATVQASGTTASARTPDWLKTMAADEKWRTQVRRYVNMESDAHGPAWSAPEAGRMIDPTIRARQDAQDARVAAQDFRAIIVQLPAKPPAGDSHVYYKLQATSQGLSRDIAMDDRSATLQPLRPSASLSLRLIQREPGFIGAFKSDKSASTAVTVPVDAVGPGTSRTIVLDKIPDGLQSALTLELSGQVANMNDNSVGAPHHPHILKLQSGEFFDDEVSLEELHQTDYLWVEHADRYTAVLVLGNGDLRDKVFAGRDDSGERIGAYAGNFPVLAVEANAWSSISLKVQASAPGETLKVRILAVSAPEPPGKQLVLDSLAQLMDWELEGHSPSRTRISNTLAWLCKVLDARFSQADVDSAPTPESRALIAQLAQSTGGAP